MALALSVRPGSRILSLAALTGSVSASGADAMVTTTIAHGIIPGSLVYIYSNRYEYNGYWVITVITPTSFTMKGVYTQFETQKFIQAATVLVYKVVVTTRWLSVHQPMLFQLTSDKWPVNSVDTARTVTSFSNSNGYTQVNLSGDIKASGSADALEQVKINGTAALDGVYKILSWSSDVNFVIDLTYNSANSFSGGTIQYYYGNYHARIRVYAGLPITHRFADLKPYELITEFRQTPDSNNRINVNVNEFVKQGIGILKNNTLLGTLPNNLDAFCFFYITFAESYDDSNQYGTNVLNVTEFVGPYSSSEAVPNMALNSKMPFKNRYSGALNDYIWGGPEGAKQKFLTGFTRPTLWPGKYFDVSFIVDDNTMSGYYILRRNYLNGVQISQSAEVITDLDIGVYRFSLDQTAAGEDKIELTLFNSTYGNELQLSETLTIDVDTACSPQDFYITWLNNLGGFDFWNFKGETQYGNSILESKTQEKNIFVDFPRSIGEFEDSIETQTVRRTKDTVTLNSQYVDNEQGKFDGLINIIESPLVQKMTSVYDRRTIILGNSSQNTKVDNQKLLMLTVQARYTDENPSQAL